MSFKHRQYKNMYASRRKKKNIFLRVVLIIFAVIVFASITSFAIYKLVTIKNEAKEIENLDSAQMKNDIYIDFSLIGMKNLLSIQGLTKQEVYDKVLGSYKYRYTIFNSNPEIDRFTMPKYGTEEEVVDYSKYMADKADDNRGTSQEVEVVNPLADITIKANKESFEFPDFFEGQLKKLIDDIYDKYLYVTSKEFKKKKRDIEEGNVKADFVFKIEDNDEFLDDALSQLARLWDTKAVRGQVEGFDRTTNEFTFGDDHKGYVIDQNELRRKIVEIANSGKLEADIWTILKTVEPEKGSIKSKYKYVSVFETWTTDNEKRNKNIELACKGLNGKIVNPGEEFSFNNTLGERTEEKGYDFAPAYLEGQVIEELGGGVCQVSTTLYNAVFSAGLLTTYRKSHTFEPSYITPGLDATVSFRGPDYRFINNTDYSVGIRATYAKNKIKIEIFSVPILKEGVVQNLVSLKLQDIDEPTLSIIREGKANKGSKGSEWQVFKVVKESEKEIERTHDHYTKYQGHTPTAFEEYTYVDDDGVLQTKKFVETLKTEATSERKSSIVTVENSENAIKETTRNNR